MNTAPSSLLTSYEPSSRNPRLLLPRPHLSCTSLPMKPYIAIPVTAAIALRSYRRRSLTPFGIVAALATATIHALHPSALPFTLLFTFFIIGTTATKVKHNVKATLTLSSSGGSGGEGARTSTQVLANSGCATILCAVDVLRYGVGHEFICFPSWKEGDLISTLCMVGIIANYAAVMADTISSELGILAKRQPILITTLKKVAKGTNGGVTLDGLLYGMLGSAVIAATSLLFLPFCSSESPPILSRTKPTFSADSTPSKLGVFIFFTLAGTAGTLLDSLLGALVQASVIDRRSGKVVEGPGGVKVLTTRRASASSNPSSPPRGRVTEKQAAGQESRFIGSGKDLLDNNQVNFLMASLITIGAMGLAGVLW
jgi:uncharacterized protein (TIGR00297 family)